MYQLITWEMSSYWKCQKWRGWNLEPSMFLQFQCLNFHNLVLIQADPCLHYVHAYCLSFAERNTDGPLSKMSFVHLRYLFSYSVIVYFSSRFFIFKRIVPILEFCLNELLITFTCIFSLPDIWFLVCGSFVTVFL